MSEKCEINKHLLKILSEERPKAFRLVINKYCQELIRMSIENSTDINPVTDLYKEIQDLRHKARELKDGTVPNILFLTINPKPDISLNEFKKVMNKIVIKKWCNKYMYVYEQRGVNELEIGKGFHSHIIIYRDGKRASEAIREIQNTVKNITNTNDDRIFNVRFVNEDDTNVARVINYITGIKKDEDKHIKQDLDKIFRERNGLKDYYQQNIISTINSQNG